MPGGDGWRRAGQWSQRNPVRLRLRERGGPGGEATLQPPTRSKPPANPAKGVPRAGRATRAKAQHEGGPNEVAIAGEGSWMAGRRLSVHSLHGKGAYNGAVEARVNR